MRGRKGLRGLLAVAGVFGWSLTVFAGESFVGGTYVNGINISGKTVEEARSYIEGFYSDNYSIVLKGKGRQEWIKGSEIGYRVSAPVNLQEILDQENAAGLTNGPGKRYDYSGSGMSSQYSEEALRSRISDLDMVKNAVKTQNARITDAPPFSVIAEVYGSSLDQEKLFQLVRSALAEGRQELVLDGAGVYDEVSVRASELRELCDSMNRIGGICITTDIMGNKEQLSGATISGWVKGSDGSSVLLDEEKVAGYVRGLEEKYGTLGNNQIWKSASGREIVMNTPYGLHLNVPEETAALIRSIRELKSTEREPVYACRPVQLAQPQFGSSFVEVDLALQHVYYYQDGNCVWDSPCVTGTATNAGRATPPGVFSISYKQTDRVLRGRMINGKPEYESHVDYWMPFNGGIGLHDANWRSSFGGKIYRNNGSHGCINLPPDRAAALYGMVEKGTIVVVHG